MHWEDSRALDPRDLRQLRLAFVEGPEAFGFKFEGAGDVEGVEGSHPELRTIFASELAAYLKSVLWDWHGEPASGGAVLFQLGAHPLCFRQR